MDRGSLIIGLVFLCANIWVMKFRVIIENMIHGKGDEFGHRRHYTISGECTSFRVNIISHISIYEIVAVQNVRNY